jgi:hypothetical protein
MEGWIKNWLDVQRARGERCLEVKKIGDNYYVYRSTTRYNRETKKRDKVSTYLGILDRENMAVRPKKGRVTSSNLRGVYEYGNSLVLHKMMAKLRTVLMEAFPLEWRELYALALVRAQAYTPLKRAGPAWSKLYDPHSIEPDMEPANLSKMLKRVGVDRKAQARVFKQLAVEGGELIYDLSAVHTRGSLNFAEKGYNKDHLFLPQINLALFCDANSGLPTMIRCLPGSVRDVKSLYNSLREVDMTDKTLVLDRGFFSDKSLVHFKKEAYNFVVPAWRNSRYYKLDYLVHAHFFYHDRLVHYTKKKVDGIFFYMYEDQDLQRDETRTLYKRLDAGQITPDEFEAEKTKAGRILIASSLDKDEKQVFLLYKSRDRIEKLFDTYKTVLNADRLYLQDNETLFGHVFTSFLSLYAYANLQNHIKKAGLDDQYSPLDILLMYSKVYLLQLEEEKLVTDVPKKIEQLDKAIHLDIFPKTKS